MHPLRAYREARKLKIDDVVRATKLSSASVSRIENWTQYPSSKALEKLIAFTGNRLTPNDFFTKPAEPALTATP